MILQFFKVFGLLLWLTSLSACRQDKKEDVDEFYTEKGEWDSARLPLIKPYEAVISNRDYDWCMNLLAPSDGVTMLSHIKNTNIVNGYILIHAGKTRFIDTEINDSWWVISPSRKIEQGFKDHLQYLAYLKTLGFKKEPRSHDIKVIASYYENHDTIDWNELAEPQE